MNREQAKDHIKRRLEDYLTAKGINTKKPFICLNPTHHEEHPSMSYDNNQQRVHCFSCQVSYDIFDLIGMDYRLTGADLFNKAYEMYNISIDNESHYSKGSIQAPNTAVESEKMVDNTEYYKKCSANLQGIERTYLEYRGISKATQERFKIGHDPEFFFDMKNPRCPAVIIPLTQSTYIARSETVGDKNFRFKGNTALFNKEALTAGKDPVFITEGTIDALSIIEAGGEAVALNGCNTELLVEYVKKAPTNCPLLILALDNDDAGKKATDKLYKALKELDIECYKQNSMYGKYKDANEALMDMGSHYLSLKVQEVIRNPKSAEQREYCNKNSVENILSDFRNIESNEIFDKNYIPTGFKKLDNRLNGGLTDGLYCIGAIPALGKTTFVMQMADEIASSGQDVLIFSLEMSKYELMAKSISRHSSFEALARFKDGYNLNHSIHIKDITCKESYIKLDEKQKEILNISLSRCSEYSDRLFIVEGVASLSVEQIETAVSEHINQTGRTPVVFIDYLQIILSDSPKLDKRGSIDYIVTSLKRISRDYKLPVVVVSAFNRDNYSNAVSMLSFKESGGIEYTADVLIGLQFEGMPEKSEKSDYPFDVKGAMRGKDGERKIELHILKNRNGVAGSILTFAYMPAYHFFSEAAGKADD